MYLKTLAYAEFPFQPNQWAVEKMHFGNINLIVGTNSSGKSRVLNVIGALARAIAGKNPSGYESGTWIAEFERHKGLSQENQTYTLSYKNKVVTKEIFTIKGVSIMERNEQGEGFVLKKKSNEKTKYKVPLNQLMSVVRSDEFQHPQFESLHKWGNSLCLYRFGSEFGKTNLTILQHATTEHTPAEFDISDYADNASSVFKATLDKFGNIYKQMMLADLNTLGYPCDDILLISVTDVLIGGVAPLSVAVRESDLDCYTHQNEMSQGMYRAVAILIQINANILWTQSKMVGRLPTHGDSPMIVIDDIGEGLDHARSKKLIALLINKSLENKIQLVMSSNDRYVMNDVPLEYWTVLHRTGGLVNAYNIINSKELFEDFQFLGLSNFDFFSGEHFLQGKNE